MGNDINTDINFNNQENCNQNDHNSSEIYFNAYTPSSADNANSNDGKGKDKINPDKIEQLAAKINSKSNNYIHNFANKWLHKVDLRPVVITNKLYGMNNKQVECQDLIETTNNIIIHHSGIQLTLLNDDNDKESYLIFPNYPTIIADLLMKDDIKNKNHIDIKQSITCHLYESSSGSMDLNNETERYPMYGYDYGYIKKGWTNESDEIQIWLKTDMYQQLLFENEEFKSKSALPMDVLHIICDEYLNDIAHNDVDLYEITPALVTKHYMKEASDNYDGICHKLKNDNSEENIIFNTAINIWGKYFTLETLLNVSCYDIDISAIDYTISCDETSAQDDIIGKIY